MQFLWLFFCLIPFSIVAQQTGWQALTISDGLSQGMVFDLEQDKEGFIWIATKEGLNRYDGHNFTTFTHDPYNKYSISDDNCSALLVDSRGWLWVGTINQGLNLLNPRTQRFYHIDIRDQTSASAGNYGISYLHEDPKGDIWVVTDYRKLYKISLSDALKTSFPAQSNLTKQVQITQVPMPEKIVATLNGLSFRADGQAMAICATGLQYFTWDNPVKLGQYEFIQNSLPEFYTTEGDINQDFWCAGFSGKVFCRWKGLTRDIFLTKKGAYQIKIKILDSKKIAIAADNLLWLMSTDELMRQDSLTARNAFAILPPNLYGITDILVDQTGNFWIGTSGYGIRRFNPKVKQFHSSLPATSLSYIYTDRQGRTYVRHEFAYDQLDRAKNRLTPFLPESLPPADKRARYLMQDRQGTFWVSNTNFQTHEMSLFKFSSDWKLLKKYPLPPNTSFGFSINQTIDDKQGRLWIGLLNGTLLQFDPKTETFRVFSYQSLLPQKITDIETTALYFDQQGTLWIGTTRGLIRADHPLTIPAFSLYKNSVDDRHSLNKDIVSSLIDDPYQPAKYLWVGTKGGGLNRLDKQFRNAGSGHFDHVTEKDGLPNKVVYGILADEFKNLWVSTNRGLAQFDPQTRKFRKFTKADGIQDDEFNTGSFFKTPSGELLFGGVNGLTAFRPKDVVTTTSGAAPRVHIVGLKINNEVIPVGAPDGILTQCIEQTDQLDLSPAQNSFTLEFAVMDYTNPTKNQFRYRLNGIDREWVAAGTNRFANYAQLPSGTYTFELEGSPNGDVWRKSAPLIIRIHPPFYRTWWAYLVYFLMLLLLGWQLYRFQKQRWLLQQQVVLEQKEASRLAELDTLKTQFFTNISHEFRTPLTLILGPLMDLKQRFQTEKAVMLTEPVVTLMVQNSNRLLSLINQLLDLGKLEAGKLSVERQTGDIAVFLRTLASSFGSLAQSRGIDFSFNQSHPHFQASFDSDKLEKIITNLLSNAFKFTPEGKQVRLQIDYPKPGETDDLVMRVEDTGIGIASAHLAAIYERFYQVDSKASRLYEGTGIGLSLVNELVNVLGGTITVSSQEGIGTTFTVRLPLTGPGQPIGEELESVDALVYSPIPKETLIRETLPTSATDTILLIIDDNADIRAYVRSVFASSYRIIEAEDGLDGLEKATASLPDVIICDLMMPRLDGLGFCRQLKSQETTSHIPVVMLTAKATLEARIEGFELGADEYLTKPFNQTELKVRVRNLMQKQARLQQYYSGKIGTVSEVVNEPARSKKEDAFLQKAHEVVLAHLANSSFGMEEFSQQMNISQSQLLRKLKALTGQTAVEYIRNIRLQQAAEQLRRRLSVSEVAYQVGFESLSYFARVFQEKYGVLPSAYESLTQPGDD